MSPQFGRHVITHIFRIMEVDTDSKSQSVQARAARHTGLTFYLRLTHL